MAEALQEIIPITTGFSKAFLIRGQGNILVDTGAGKSFEIIGKALEAQKLRFTDISHIFITHCHHDHLSDLVKICVASGAQVAVHRLEAPSLRGGRNADVVPVTFAGKLFLLLAKLPPIADSLRFTGIEPHLQIDSELSLEEFGIRGMAIHTPGHTPGSVSYLLEGGEVIIGDLLMSWKPGGKPQYPMFATDLEALRGSIKNLLDRGARMFYLSHGGVCEASEIEKLLK
ncbi:MAG: MBL fold metallo-hydrolase [Candidatus Eremiobacteraeota bacterium]|nr:MBL fold metallo-hydrolase [Candidatus Eremiobacteraeota bacterium]